MKSNIKHIITRITLVIFSSTIISCRQSSDHITDPGTGTGPASVKINLQGSDYNDGETSKTAGINGINSAAVQTEEISFNNNNDYKLIATLTPTGSISQVSPKASARAATTTPLPVNTRYKVVVFNNSGNYITEINYTSGQEATATPITGLTGGQSYTFVAYSTGSTTALPNITYTNPLTKTLATASVNNVSGDSDLMYFSKTITLTGNSTNYLDVVFRHKYSQIITTLDSSATLWYSIDNSSITGAILSPHNNSAVLKLSDGSVTNSGSTTKALTFPVSSGTSTSITANPVMINTPAITNGVFMLGSIKLTSFGGAAAVSVIHENIILGGLKITPGVKYNLKLSFIPNDRYIPNFRGYPAVSINGVIYMRHNLGANYASAPDVLSPNIVGNYYQWGRKTAVATVTTGTGPISGWDNTTIPSVTSWNTGTRINPIKNTANDPCPSGWRVGSRNELGILTNIPYTSIGNPFTTSPSSAGLVFVSRFNPDVKITFPQAGFRNGIDGSFNSSGSNGIEGIYWPSDSNWFGRYNTAGMVYYSFTSGAATTYNGSTVRCVAEYPY
ncbi:fimbrillin family protein [Elizabethkingia miricola]|uniref:fimbrillin family protein n=1 Tax=Elizabethkingia miricola TaxID=172045 RepID=UPI000B3624F2|nr:fimbrillin family protein [Elizabethkingia miricola]PSL88123.1 hypothetical protein C7V10_12415 [Elizabethkingia miricola]QHQ85927.1 fimbrillin family protein [Elizabethkingia miricola]UIO97179.1 fimbrillin family protein [Elizabethkingia miricola]WER13956.1 fimbrillin family protein [Elizabethkingia miricola]WGL74133.1 fimbrillin family protein [Elizabethkingia miricola]